MTRCLDKASILLTLLSLIWTLSSCQPHYPCREGFGRPENGPAVSKIETQDNPNSQYFRIDPIFKKQTPLLFAHRGGVLEAPESTRAAFRHALYTARADILELDVQMTKDRRIVVWHGPSLRKVCIGNVDPNPSNRPKGERDINDFYWEPSSGAAKSLKGNAWVAAPAEAGDLTSVPQIRDRELMLLSEFLDEFPTAPLNIELKKTFKDKDLSLNIARFLTILKNGSGNRVIVVASASHDIIKEFRKQNIKNYPDHIYPTNLSPLEILTLSFSSKDLTNHALETSYANILPMPDIIETVRNRCGATYVFLTRFGPIPAIDKKPSRKYIRKLLDYGVDGVMTDRPATVREIIDEWKKEIQTAKMPTQM